MSIIDTCVSPYAHLPSSLLNRSAVHVQLAQHFALVRRLARHVHRKVSASAEIEDLVQIGMIALVEAAQTFEDRGFAFATYASIRIKGSMIDYLRQNSGRSRKASFARRTIDAARRTVEQGGQLPATAPSIAAHMKIGLPEYFAMEKDAQGTSHLPIEEAYSDGDLTFSSADPLADASIDALAITERLHRAIDTLDKRSRQVLQLYFFEELSLEEIGQVLDVGAARVCQIKKAALARLRAIEGFNLA